MVRYVVSSIATKYWKPGEDFIDEITETVAGKVADEDFVIVSEKAVSTALGNIVDESIFEPSLSARTIALAWMRIGWGFFLGPLCNFRQDLIMRLRHYPAEMGSRHKQVALQYSGLLQALMFGSEGGIDGSNLPYAYVGLPLIDALSIAEKIRDRIRRVLHKHVCVMIADTDKTYSLRNFHFTPRPRPIKGIHSFGAVGAFVFGRMLRLRRRATPLAVAGGEMSAEQALEIAEVADRSRGFGAGRTVWEMAERFGVDLTAVSWEMLETVRHKPIVILRSKRWKGDGRNREET